MEEKITNLEELPKEVWEELRKSSETMIRNSKIGYFQGLTLLDLANQKISELKTDEEKEGEESVKEIISKIL